MKAATKRLLEEQIAAVVVPGRGEKNDTMWHVPHMSEVNFISIKLISLFVSADILFRRPLNYFCLPTSVLRMRLLNYLWPPAVENFPLCWKICNSFFCSKYYNMHNYARVKPSSDA